MSSRRRRYPSDLSDTQWDHIRGLIPAARTGGRSRTTDVREVLNAVLYLNRTGCAWRYLPSQFPPWQTVYDYFWKWSQTNLWLLLCRTLTIKLRKLAGRSALPHLGIVDSQSVRTHYGEEKGWDGYKKVRGRKRHILVDSLGLVWLCKAHSASLSDHQGAAALFKRLPDEVKNGMEVLLGDGAYRREPLPSICEAFNIQLITLNAKKLGQNMKPKRWIVERTFAWFNLARRLSRDYEKRTSYSESMVYAAMLPILLRRLCLS